MASESKIARFLAQHANPTVVAIGLVGVVVAVLLGQVQTQSRLDDMGGRIDETNARIDETNRRIDETGARLDARIDRVQARIDRVQQTLAEIQATNARILLALEGVSTRLDSLERAVAAQNERLAPLLDLPARVAALENAGETRAGARTEIPTDPPAPAANAPPSR